MATVLSQKRNTRSLIVIIWALLALGAVFAAIAAGDYPPLGRTWEIKTLAWALLGSVAGMIIALFVRRLIVREVKRSPGFFGIIGVAGLTILWALIIAGFLQNMPPGQNAFTVPNSPDLYLVITALASFVAFFWLMVWGSEIAPGLMLVMLAGTAGGVMFNLHGAATDLLFMMMAALWAGMVWCRCGQPSMSHPLVGGGFILIILVIFAGTFGVYPGNSFHLALRMSSGWIVALGVLSARAEKEKDLMPALLASGILLAILTLVRYFILIHDFSLDYAVAMRLWIAGANPNALASALLLTVAVLFTSTPKTAGGRILWGLMLLLTLLMMYLSLSKAVWLGLLLLVFLGFLIRNRNLKRNLMIFLILALALVAITVLVPSIRGRILDEFSFSSRIVMWQAVLGNISQHLLFGVGPGNSFIHAASVNTLPYEVVFPMREYFGGHSHDLWLEITEGVGLLGLVIFLWMVFIIVRRAGRASSWLISGFLGLMLTLSLSIGLSVNQLLPLELWVFLGLIAVPNVRGKRWLFAFAGIATLFAISWSVSDALVRQVDQWTYRGENDRAMWRLNVAAILNPWDALIPEKQARLAMAELDVDAMLRYYDRCVVLAPGHPALRAKRGMVRLLADDLQGAGEDLERAVAGDDFGILSGDLHAPMAIVFSAMNDANAVGEELHKLTSRDPFFPQGPWSALRATKDGWEVVLCPDFMPGGNKAEQRRRVLLWLGSDTVSRNALRRVYPAETKAYSYSRAVDDELDGSLTLASNDVYQAPFSSYQVGLSYFQLRKMLGKEGSDLALLFGGFDKISPEIIKQIDTTEVFVKAPELFRLTSCLGLARAAQLAGKNELYHAFLDEALQIAERSPGDLVARVRNVGVEDSFVWPESVVSNLARATTDVNKADYAAAANDLEGYFRMAILTQQGWESWETVAGIIVKLKSDGSKVVDDIIAEYPNEPLPVIVKAYAARYYGDIECATNLYQKAQRLANGNRVIVKACCEGYFVIGDTKNGIEAANNYSHRWHDDILTLISFQRIIAIAGMVNQAEAWQNDLMERFPFSADLALSQADYYKGLKDWKLAEDYLLKARNLYPTSAAVHEKLARFYSGRGMKDKAKTEYNTALGINPGDVGSRIGLAEIYVDEKEYDKAVAYVEFARQLAPEEVWTNTSLAAILSRAGRKKEALAVLEAFLKQQPEAWDALKWHARIADELGLTELAYADLSSLITSRHADMSVYIKMAEYLQSQGEIEQAIDMLIKGTQINPTDEWGWETLGYMISQADFFDQMQEWLSNLFAINPNSDDLKLLKSQLVVLFKDTMTYKSNITNALQNSPQSSVLKAAWGGILYRENKLGEAGRIWDEVLASNPNEMYALAMKATLALQAKNGAGALDFATRAQKVAPTSAWTNVLLAQALDANSRQTEAVTILDQYLASNPDSRYTRLWRARLCEKSGDAKKALSDYELLVELRKGDLSSYVRVAEAKMAEKSGEAVTTIEVATRLYPRDAWAWATYGYMLLQTDEKAKARMAIEKAVKLDPANTNYPKLLNTIPVQ